MNRYDSTFNRLRANRQIAFVPFAVAGDPDLKTSEAIFKTYIDNGADILEIGYPFSDPIADGPINQRAAIRAINSGLEHDTFFALIAKIRKMTDIPMGLLLYANSALAIGYASFCKRAAEAGLDSLLIADMPPEEAGEMLHALKTNNLRSVFIISELTPPERVKSICSAINGFVYVVSRTGTTGTQTAVNATVGDTLKRLKKITSKPLVVGFGLSKPEHIATIKNCGADGAIVGSALVSIIEKNLSNKKTMLSLLGKAVKGYKRATE